MITINFIESTKKRGLGSQEKKPKKKQKKKRDKVQALGRMRLAKQKEDGENKFEKNDDGLYEFVSGGKKKKSFLSKSKILDHILGPQ